MQKITNKIKLPHAILMYAVTSLFLAFEMALQVSPSIMTHDLIGAFHVDAYWLGIISGSYFISYTIMQIPAGILFGYFNTRNVIVIPLILCAIGASLFAISNQIIVAIMARIFMGIGSAFAFISVLVVVADVFDKKYYGLFTGITQMIAAIGAMCGQLPLLYLKNLTNWHVVMYVIAMLGIILAFTVWFVVNYKKCNCYLDARANIPDFFRSFFTVIKNPRSWWIALYACCLWAPMSAFASLWGVPFLEAKGFSATIATQLVMLMWVGLAIGSPLIGFLSDRFNTRFLFLCLSALIGAIAFAIILFLPNNSFIITIMILLAGGACAGQALSFAVVSEQNNKATNAVAISFNNMAVVISGALLQPLAGKLIQSYGHKKLVSDAATYSPNAYKFGLSAILICYIISFIVSFVLARRK